MTSPLVEKGLAALTRQVIHSNVIEPRKCWEVSTPTTQCNSIIGPFEDNTPCYICGMEIKKAIELSKENANADYIAGDGLNPECEHILPISEAIIYLGLESPQFRKNPWYIRDILKYEYAWSHRTCNQVKSDTSFVVKRKNTDLYVVDIIGLKTLLTKIWNTTRSDSIDFKKSLKTRYGNIESFKKARIGSSNNGPVIEQFQTICDYLNSFNAPNLVLLAGVCGISNINSKKSAYARDMQAKRNDPNYLKKQEEEKFKSNTKQFNTIYNKVYRQVLPELNRICNPSRYPEVYSKYNESFEKQRDYFITIMRQASQESNEILIKFIKVSLIQLFLESFRAIESSNSRGITLAEKQMRKNESMLPNIFKKATNTLSRNQFTNKSSVITPSLTRKRPRNNISVNNKNNNKEPLRKKRRNNLPITETNLEAAKNLMLLSKTSIKNNYNVTQKIKNNKDN